MEPESGFSFSPGNLLLCRESIDSLFEEGEVFDEVGWDVEAVLRESLEEEYVEMVINREELSVRIPTSEFVDDWVKEARLDGIRYILRKREILGFGFQTAYISVTYLDRFLSQGTLNEEAPWVMRVLSMACLSLAAKMEESRVTKLWEFCLDDYNFGCQMIQRVELLVLIALDWKMGTITPFAFIHFFSVKLLDNYFPARSAVTSTVDIILSSMTDLRIMSYKPYIVAAAATLAVIGKRFTRETLQKKLGSITSSLNVEDIISCYALVQQLNKENIASPAVSTHGVWRKSLISSSRGIKGSWCSMKNREIRKTGSFFGYSFWCT